MRNFQLVKMVRQNHNYQKLLWIQNQKIFLQLQLAIDASMQIPQNSLSLGELVSSLPTKLKYEITVAEQTGKRGYYLNKVYQMMLTIPATSVEAERTFSSCAYLCNKL